MTAYFYNLFFGTRSDDAAGGNRNGEGDDVERQQLLELQRRRQQRQQQQQQHMLKSGREEVAGRPNSKLSNKGNGAASSNASMRHNLFNRKFFGARIITVTANNILFTKKTSQPDDNTASASSTPTKHYSLNVPTFRVICSLSRLIHGSLFIISMVEDDEEEEIVFNLLREGIQNEAGSGSESYSGKGKGKSSSSSMKEGTNSDLKLHIEDHKLLFCSTAPGKTAIVRYVNPQKFIILQNMMENVLIYILRAFLTIFS